MQLTSFLYTGSFHIELWENRLEEKPSLCLAPSPPTCFGKPAHITQRGRTRTKVYPRAVRYFDLAHLYVSFALIDPHPHTPSVAPSQARAGAPFPVYNEEAHRRPRARNTEKSISAAYFCCGVN